LLASNLQAKDGLHIFTDRQDRVVSARIVNLDERRGLVELELENKRRTKVKPSIFIEKDQAYIRDWGIGQAFMASSGLRFSGEKEVIEDWSDSPGTGINQEFEKTVYNCELKNGSSVSFENVDVEYCVFWVQEVPEASGERRLEKDYSGRYAIPRMEPRSTTDFATDPVTLVYQHLAGGYYYSNGATGKQSSKMKGVWLRVSMTTKSGETYTREFCEPTGVMKHQVWKAPPEISPEESPPEKKKKSKKKKRL
jgi:hypothetical protein